MNLLIIMSIIAIVAYFTAKAEYKNKIKEPNPEDGFIQIIGNDHYMVKKGQRTKIK